MERIAKFVESGIGQYTLLAAIVLIAFFFRSYKIDTLPTGLFIDEAANAGCAVYAMKSGDYKVFYPDNNGREGLFINLVAFCFKNFGVGVLQLKLPSMIMGVLGVIGVWFLAQELFRNRPRLALIAAYLTAVSFWPVNFSRIAFRAIMMLPILTFAFALFFRGIRTKSYTALASGGLIFGLGLHTYIAFRIAPFILAVLVVLFSAHDRKHLRHKFWQGVAVYCLAALLGASPMLWTFCKHPEYITSRTSQVSIFSQKDIPVVATLAQNVVTSLLQFNIKGDQNWRHHYPPLPQLEPVTGVFFAAGILLSCCMALSLSILRIFYGVKNRNLIVHCFLLTWFMALLAPSFMAGDNALPHALRSIGTVPVVFIFSAYFIDSLLSYIYLYFLKAYKKIAALTLVFIAYAGIFGAVEYFVLWGRSPSQPPAFGAHMGAAVGYALQLLQMHKDQLY